MTVLPLATSANHTLLWVIMGLLGCFIPLAPILSAAADPSTDEGPPGLTLTLISKEYDFKAERQEGEDTPQVEKTKTVHDARIRIESSYGYNRGRACQQFEGLYVTAPIEAPRGVQIKPRLVPWEKVAKVDWTADFPHSNSSQPEILLTLTDGTAEKAFAWSKGSERYHPLKPGDFCIDGTMEISGETLDVEIRGAFRTLIFER